MSVGTTDRSLLRWLRARVDEDEVLNPHEGTPAADGAIAGRLMREARVLLTWVGRTSTPYAQIAGSAPFAAYRALADGLRAFDPATLEGRCARTAFWINLYNALVVDAVITYGVRESIRETPGFFRRAADQVGPHRLSLEEIEHGLLRANRPPLPGLPPPFAPGDARAALGPGALDPRVHFALNCGTRSCPPIAFYEAARLDEQLEAAAASFINAEGVRTERDEPLLSPIFAFYAEDFGGAEGARAWVLRYLTDPALRALVESGPLRAAGYDWSLYPD